MVSTPRIIPDDIRARQARASDPRLSAFVAANAGSGKTHVLVNRVIRLLLQGVAPDRILCITFTKAAAANMAQRVFARLGTWVGFDDAELNAAISDVGEQPTREARARARELFARALETPGGLKVQTIHALCTRLLQQFPFEANVAAGFSVLDDRDRDAMMERANLDVLLKAAAQPDSLTGRALAIAMTTAADVTFQTMIREACLSREHFMTWVDQAGGPQKALDELRAALGLAESETLENVTQAIIDGPNLPRSAWADAAGAFEGGSANDQKQAIKLRMALAAGEDGIDDYLSVFFGDDGEARKSLITKALAKFQAGLAARLDSEQQRLTGLVEKLKAARIRQRSEAMIFIGYAVADSYRREKQERGLLDYDDLIDKTLAMLNRTHTTWVHYKLDRGIDHVLIDEAQDTSPRQWDIIAHIIGDFASGAGARAGINRTVFAVGDEKQSIFSFQGAAPKEFNARRHALHRQFDSAGLNWDNEIRLNFSFRSGAAILGAVDRVFFDQDVYRSIHAVENDRPLHEALPDAAPSLIELWNFDENDPRQEIEGWRAPFDAMQETSAPVKLAKRIARQVRAMIAARETVSHNGKPRAITPGDVLVLVRRRGVLFDAVIQALKRADIPVAGADRLKLTEHIAVIDLIKLADAILCPQDDLALAIALKSPVFGLSEDDLFQIAAGRTGTLRDALAHKAGEGGAFAAAEQRLASFTERALNEMPFAFFAHVLGGDGARARMLKRLGGEANDALDEFLELALAYEQREVPSLQGFIAWLRAAETEVKRDMDIERDEVRVMTVHGAKGLEAPVVFLADTTGLASDTHRPSLIRLPLSGGRHGVVWGGRKADDPQAVANARAAMMTDADDEYRRLLYVGLTRAAERLIIGGCKPGNRRVLDPNCWYELIRRGLEAAAEAADLKVEQFKIDGHEARRFFREGLVPTKGVAQFALQLPEGREPPPSWLHESAASSAELRPLRPSRSDAPDRAVQAGMRKQAIRRGLIVHRLMQSLPDVSTENRREAAERYLERNAADWDDVARAALLDRVLAILADEKFSALFADGSRAEVPVVGRIDRTGGSPVMVSGQVDRVTVSADRVMIADYKTDARPPRSVDRVPEPYVRQLALYRAVLGRLYPGKVVHASLLWTETAEIMEIPQARLDAEMARISMDFRDFNADASY